MEKDKIDEALEILKDLQKKWDEEKKEQIFPSVSYPNIYPYYPYYPYPPCYPCPPTFPPYPNYPWITWY